MSIDSTEKRAITVRTQLGVSWLTVLPPAIMLAYADGFWMLSLRGAVGAIERTLGERALRTKDLGGDADTTACGKAVADMVD